MAFILQESIGSILKITLNRPEVYNSFHRAMALALQESLRVAENDQYRAVCITGGGKAFSAGQDLQEVTADPPMPIRTILQEHYNPIIRQIRALKKPVIAAVNGVAAGAGANIALSCDIVIAAESASFIQAFSKIGLIPDSGGTYVLPRLIGFARSSALMMTGDKLTAKEAERIGLISYVYPDADFQEAVMQFCDKMDKMPTHGLALTKAALNKSVFAGLDQQLELEDELQFQAACTFDYQEGVQAFLEKRAPTFQGK